MILKRITEILGALDKGDLKKFERFLRTGYFNTNERVYKLFKILKIFYPLFDNPKLTNEYLFKRIYLQKKFNDRTLKYLLSELLHLEEKFLSIANMEDDENEMNKRLIESLIVKKLFSHAHRRLKANDKNFDSNFEISGPGINKRYDNSTAWHQLYFFSGKQDPLFEKRIEQGEYLAFNSIIEICHTFQNLTMLKSRYNVELEDNIFFAYLKNLDYRGLYKYLNIIENSFKTNKRKSALVKAFKIYLCFMITFMDEKDEEYFFKMKGMIEKYNRLFSIDELQNLHVMLVNCCEIKRKKINEEKYLKYLYEIMKSALSMKLYSASYKGQYMQVASFDRIFNTSFALKKFSWAKDFINQYKRELPPEYSEDVFHYSTAELLFRKKQFENALESLSKIKGFKYFQHKIKVRNLSLMIYYELKYNEQAFALINSYSRFLTSNKRVRPEQKEAELNFLSLIKELFKASENGINGPDLIKLKKNTAGSNLLSRKEWLMEKINELK
jgi:hypothetical protein